MTTSNENISTTETETKTTTTTTPEKGATGYVDPDRKPTEEKPAEETNLYGYDNLGEKTPEQIEADKKTADEKTTADKVIADKAIEDAKVKDPSTGYAPKTPEQIEADKKAADEKTTADKKAADEIEAAKTPEQKAADKIEADKKAAADKIEADKKAAEGISKEDIDTTLGDLYDKDIVSKFMVDNKMTKAQVEAYVQLRKSEDAKLIKDSEDKIAETRASWLTELKTDADFGGENFEANVDRAEKVLEEFLPNTKKALTGRGSMMPPYIMRDLLALYKTMNPTTKLITGDPIELVKKESGNFLTDMYK